MEINIFAGRESQPDSGRGDASLEGDFDASGQEEKNYGASHQDLIRHKRNRP